ncbi:DUF4136 domain-containing protein [Sediminibacterium soli]|uniref:DUF4136 domain-containing protein n=1 Tax=Sediminibacterium soli TaxID=2698829 RepID=UPI00137A67C9|nr:DUF4136 domain-containing protein [Sediminibacterium soli]NCI46811.1 DUF4136 domain-containing protein [Sediminibacterium soli]
MKTIHHTSGAALVLLLLAACAAPVHVQQDPALNLADYHTYSWVETRSNQDDKASRAMAYADISVRNAGSAELQQKGWREAADNPDLILSYDVIVERSREERSDPVYSQPFTRMYYNPYSRRWGSIYYPSQFIGYQNYSVPVREGTLTITLTDAKTDKTIWQGWTTERMNYTRFTENQLNKMVHNILKKLP